MRRFARFFLWLMGVAVPVFLAACYGMPYRFSKIGKVIDSESKTGINGIEVSCLNNEQVLDVSHSYEDGKFEIWYDQPCDVLVFEDVDGEENGGLYSQKQIVFDEDTDNIIVEMDQEI